ncbi:MAG: TrkH family potassium uptake protein [Candidatus Diapherotrites archaeon]|nr:TrkH family potassium uptake protein [Candidatus Diapherotrites archaeon]
MILKDDIFVILRDTGEVMKWFSVAFSVPLLYSVLFEQNIGIIFSFLVSMMLCFIIGFLLYRTFKVKRETRRMHALVSVFLVWVLICVVSALPLYLGAGKGFIDSLFASTASITTTGFNIFTEQEMIALPHSIILWLNFLSWIGGAGIVMVAMVGLLTAFAEAGKLYGAEGRAERLRPHIVNTTKLIWMIYGALTLIGVILLLFSGMNLFDAVNYSMSALSTTGFGTHTDASRVINPFIEMTLMFLSIMGAISFVAHYHVISKDKLAYFKDKQVLMLLTLIIIGTALIIPKLVAYYGTNAIRIALFHVVNAVTCGGFEYVDMSAWIGNLDFVLWVFIGLMFIGGSSGSTTGGIKIIRFIVLLKSVYWKIKRFILPEHAVFTKVVDGRKIKDSDINTTLFFTFLYALFIFIGAMVLMSCGYTATASFFEVVSAQSNVGFTVGIMSTSSPVVVKLMLIINMIVGRLEIFPILAFAGTLLKIR